MYDYNKYYEQQAKKANKIGLALRINQLQKDKLNLIRDYLKDHQDLLPEGANYRYKGHSINDAEIIRFLIANYKIPTKSKRNAKNRI